KLPFIASVGRRVRGGGDRRRARFDQTARLRRRAASYDRACRGASKIRARAARALQGAARGRVSGRAAAHASRKGRSRQTAQGLKAHVQYAVVSRKSLSPPPAWT